MDFLLNDGWFLSEGAYADDDSLLEEKSKRGAPLSVDVPGDVHSTLLKHGVIADPFYSTNAETCRWVEDRIWYYSKKFDWDGKMSEQGRAVLKFDGLDTFARVFLNDEEIGLHANMFTAVEFDVTDLLQKGENRLLVRFDSPIRMTREKDYSRMWYSYNRNRVWARKAQFGYRWDWGPRILTVGIWDDVHLCIYDTARIANVFAGTRSVSAESAELDFYVEIENFSGACGLNLTVSMEKDGQVFRSSVPVNGSKTPLQMTIPHPKLWWTSDLGNPELYQLRVELFSDGKKLDSSVQNFGIRTLSCKLQDDDGNNRFLFVLNGVELFARGADWVPASSYLGTVGENLYRKWVTLAREGNMNMLRVWGGGVYEKDAFYRECDRQGVLVWQDFMFTCSSYPDFSAEFMSEVSDEVRFAVRRLRNYACIALWCGNNEIEWLHGQKMPDLNDTRLYGAKIFEELMPELLRELDPTRLYWPSSPFGGNDPNSDEMGDKHNWQVWCGCIYPHKQGERMQEDASPEGISYRKFALDHCKFCSEFGIQSAPVLKTLQSCIPGDSLFYDSFEMRYRNKDKRPTRGKLTMEFTTGLPSTLSQYVDDSMLAQAAGLKFGIEHYRRRFPGCGGSLVWQLNDCWPAISWSIVDFYGRPKAAYYAVKNAYAPLLLSFEEDAASVTLWVTNNTQRGFRDKIAVGLRDFFGNPEYDETIFAEVSANSSKKIKSWSKNYINVTYSYFEFFFAQCISEPEFRNLLFFREYRELNLPPCNLELYCQQTLAGAELVVKTDAFAKFVCLECDEDGVTYSDNYFDLMPFEERKISVRFAQKTPRFSVRAINSKKQPGKKV